MKFQKIALTCLAALIGSANAFSAVRPDIVSTRVEEALKITASFGIDSKEAQVAWDIVEELNASDNSVATEGSLDTECEVSDEVSIACMDYSRFLDELYVIRDLIGDKKSSSKKSSLAQTLKSIQLSPPPSARANSSAQLTAALEEAKAATEQYGIASSQARLAWETYEEIAASGNDNAIGINLLEECSVESGQDACRAMEEMDRILPILLAISSK